MFADPTDPDAVYAESQGGYIGRVDRRTRAARDIQPKAGYREKLRFNWNTPIHAEPDREGHALHRRAVPVPLARPRRDLGAHLARPDDQRSGEAEAGGVGRRHRGQLRRRRCTRRSTRSASRRRTPRCIWVGTDDGNVQLTRDGGKTWTNVVGNVAGPAAGLLGELGRGEPLRRRHGLRRLRPPHLRRHDAVGLPDDRFRQDLDADRVAGDRASAATPTSSRRTSSIPTLLFVGTEFGLWISIDGGELLGGVQGRRLPERRGARPRRSSRATTTS